MDSTQFFPGNTSSPIDTGTPGKKPRKLSVKFTLPKDMRIPLVLGSALFTLCIYLLFNPPLDARQRVVLQIDALQREYHEKWTEWEALSREMVNIHEQAEALRASPVFTPVTE